MGETVVIDTKLGKLRGQIAVSALTNEKYYSFRGIPFGKPPVGELRFKAPEPFGGWEGVRDALEDGPDSKQRLVIRLPGTDPNKETDGDEDCLYLCVYTRELPEEPSSVSPIRPVLVNIHGGGFAGGSGGSKAAGPDYFMATDVVLVSFNYRCGPFGRMGETVVIDTKLGKLRGQIAVSALTNEKYYSFRGIPFGKPPVGDIKLGVLNGFSGFLSLENEEVPGNAGLKDQTLALKWVRDNIHSFGGDPNNVTIMGISAGGASVHYHLLSPLSKGLFHRAIIQSGFSQNPWALQLSPKKVALKLAKAMGCASEDPHEVLDFLKSADGDDIVKATSVFVKDEEYVMLIGLVFSPCVEVAGSEKFLPNTPNNLMKRGEYNKVPTILGVCQNEGSVFSLFVMLYQLSFNILPDAINNKPDLLVPLSLGLKPGSEEHKKVLEAIREFYFKGGNVSLSDFDSLIKFIGDYMFNIGLGETRSCLLAGTEASVYTYMFTNHSRCYCQTFTATMGPDNPAVKFLSSAGTCHATDVMYLLRMNTPGFQMPELTEAFKEAISKHVKIWTTFASTGDPNLEEMGVRWYRDSQAKPCYMDIGTDWIMKEGEPLAERIHFWQQLSEKYCKD